MKTLSLGIVISALGFGGAAASLGSVNDRISSIGRTVEKLKVQQKSALTSMDREWVWGGDAVKRYATEVEKLDKRIQTLSQRKVRLEMLGTQHSQNRADLNQRYGDVMAAAGIGATMAAPGVKAAKFEDRVKQISIVGELYKQNGAEGAMAQAIREAAVKYAVSQDQVAEGIERLVAQGMDAKSAQKYAGLLAKVNTATRTEMGDLAELVYTLQTKFKLTSEGEVMQAVNALAKAGKLGQYELKQMAKGFPELGGAAASFGSKGLDGVREMGMMMQVMRAGAGTTGEADTYMRNWFSHMSAKSTQDHFGKVGINFEREKLKLMIDKRVSAVEASFMVFDDYLNRVTNQGFVEVLDKKGKVKERIDVRQELDKVMDIAKKEGLQGQALQERVKSSVERMGLSTVLQDIQATQAYLAYRNGKEKYAEGRKELAKGETDKTIANDYAEQMKLATMQTEYMKVAVGDLMIEVGNRLAPVFGKVAGVVGWFAEKLSWLMQKFPRTTTAVITVVGALAVAAAGFFAVGAAMAAFRFAGTALQLMPLLGGGLRMVGVAAGWLGTILRGALVIGLRMAGQALLFIGRALLLNPIGLAVTVIAGAAYLIYRNWEPISAWFGKVWGKVKTAFSGAWDWFKGLPGQFSRLGSELISGLVGGITAKLSVAKDTIVGFGQNIKGWFADTLGIKSPSRVFMGFGSNIGEGAQIGIMKGVPGVQGAVGKLAGVALAGAVAASGSAFAGVKQASQMLQGIQGGGAVRSQTASAAGMTINFAPTIHVGAGGGEVRGQVNEAMKMSMHDLEQMLRRLQADQQRRAF
ncbi:phage tail tape measure protein [Polaromonas sp.]|uniref:phage tail tape measure protein n=1 Tax=Polaromonas sp. TaxID=1869339 RepID=UPI0037511E10